MYSKVVELDKLYLFAKDHFKIYWLSFQKKLNYKFKLLFS